MGKAEQTVEKILAAAQSLILESGGDAEKVTVRQIAERAGVSVGLVNYHYASKTQLIEDCVQCMIGGVVGSFVPRLPEGASRLERLGCVASQVADYLDDHPQISRISILGDLASPTARDNTIRTALGFLATAAAGTDDPEALLRAFCLASVLQCAFLRKDLLKESLGIDWNDALQREAFLKRVSQWLLSDQPE